MRAMTFDELRSLIAHETSPCLSFYLPTHRNGSSDERLRWAALLDKARSLLGSSVGAHELNALLEPLEKLSTPDFWSQQLDCLAVFRSRDRSVYYRLPIEVEELAVVADSFHVRPILRFMRSNQRYFLLNLSQGRTSFFKGSALGLGPVDLSSLPRSLTEAIGVEARERSLNFHQGGTGRGHAPIFHGSGKDDSVRDEELHRFLRTVDKALWEVLRDETAPLIVAAPERVGAMFQATSRYPHLLHDSIHGNFANAKIGDLHEKAWPIVQRWLGERETQVVERYGNLISSDKAMDDVSSIARFAIQGRVRDLLLERGAHVWGVMERATGALEVHAQQASAKDEDILDDIAEQVILRGGEVHTFPREKMPTRSPIAATLRW